MKGSIFDSSTMLQSACWVPPFRSRQLVFFFFGVRLILYCMRSTARSNTLFEKPLLGYGCNVGGERGLGLVPTGGKEVLIAWAAGQQEKKKILA